MSYCVQETDTKAITQNLSPPPCNDNEYKLYNQSSWTQGRAAAKARLECVVEINLGNYPP